MSTTAKNAITKSPMLFCEKCGELSAARTRLVEREQTLPVKGENITVHSRLRICASCKQEIYDRDLDAATLEKAFAIYRERHRLLSPEEIRAIREGYGLSQRGFGALLGLGEITIHRYESGGLPDEAPSQLLRFVRDPWNMCTLLEANGERIPKTAQQRLHRTLSVILAEDAAPRAAAALGAGLMHNGGHLPCGTRSTPASPLNGNQVFSPDTFKNMMLFFASKDKGVFKTKLNKLLWYADFHHYRTHSQSISGATYFHNHHGPVARGYDLFLAQLIEGHKLERREESFENWDQTAERLIAKNQLDLKFPESAARVLLDVQRHFATTSSRQISELSHQEIACQRTKSGQEISYEYAHQLKIDFSTKTSHPIA